MNRVGATWLTRDDREHEIADAMRWLDLVHEDMVGLRRDTVATSVLGFSQGVATAMRWVILGKVEPVAFIAWAGALANDMDFSVFARKMNGSRTILVAGSNDEFVSTHYMDLARKRLEESGVSLGVESYQGGHELQTDVLQRVLAEIAGHRQD
jgi:predicted esterase